MKEEKIRLAMVLTPYKDRAFDTISIPLGLAWINSYIKKKIPYVEIKNYDLLLQPELEKKLLSEVKGNYYDVVGIQAHSNATAHEAIRISKEIKNINSNTIIILGGNAATFSSDKFLETGYVDFIILGEGEETFTELLKKINSSYGDFSSIKGIAYKRGEKIIKTEERKLIEDLNVIPLPDRDSFSWEKYPQWSIITSRGCPYSCTYCSSTKFWRNCIRFRNADNVFEEIKILVEKYKVKRLYILDDTFGVNKEETKKLLNRMIKEKISLEWACLTRAEIVSEDMLNLFKLAGCVQIHFGLETANLETQNTIRKHLDLVKLKEMVEYCKKIAIRTKLSVIFGLPNETENNIRKTISFLEELEPNEIQIYPLMPYIGIDVLDNDLVKMRDAEKYHWKQDALVPLAESNCLPIEKQLELTQIAIEKFRKLGYKWIPMDLSPDKHDEVKIVKTVFAPIQGLKKL